MFFMVCWATARSFDEGLAEHGPPRGVAQAVAQKSDAASIGPRPMSRALCVPFESFQLKFPAKKRETATATATKPAISMNNIIISS